MNKIQMTSTARHHYNGKPLFPGDDFVADTELDASDLETLDFAKRKPHTYATRVMVAETSAGGSAADVNQNSSGSRRGGRTRELHTK